MPPTGHASTPIFATYWASLLTPPLLSLPLTGPAYSCLRSYLCQLLGKIRHAFLTSEPPPPGNPPTPTVTFLGHVLAG